MNFKKCISIFSLFFILFILNCSSAVNAGKDPEIVKKVFEENTADHLILINKNSFTLQVYDRDLNVVQNFKIGYGLNPDRKPKLYAGDNRTPEGVYRITEILSMDADKNSLTFKKLKSMNNVYFRASDGHFKFDDREADLGYNAYGTRFYRIDYPNSDDLIRYKSELIKGNIPKKGGRFLSPGSGIAIHGNNDENSIGQLSSSGCIRMYNDDIIELEKYIKPGLPVIITSF